MNSCKSGLLYQIKCAGKKIRLLVKFLIKIHKMQQFTNIKQISLFHSLPHSNVGLLVNYLYMCIILNLDSFLCYLEEQCSYNSIMGFNIKGEKKFIFFIKTSTGYIDHNERKIYSLIKKSN